MSEKLKYRLPLCAELKSGQLTGQELAQWQNIVKTHDSEFDTALAVNSQLCRFHPHLTTTAYDDLLQIGVTDSVLTNQALDLDHFSQSATLGNYKQKLKLANDINSVFSEHSFTNPTAFYTKYKNLVTQTLTKFQSVPTRIRLVKLIPGRSIPPHIDYDPSYAVRIIIPIISPDDCLNIFWFKNQIQTIHLSEGHCYFLNTGFRHAVVNMSTENRYTLMVTLNGSEDIKDLLTE